MEGSLWHHRMMARVLRSPVTTQERQGSARALRVRSNRRPSNLIWVMPAKGVRLT
jgi:hypothetical protein